MYDLSVALSLVFGHVLQLHGAENCVLRLMQYCIRRLDNRETSARPDRPTSRPLDLAVESLETVGICRKMRPDGKETMKARQLECRLEACLRQTVLLIKEHLKRGQ